MRNIISICIFFSALIAGYSQNDLVTSISSYEEENQLCTNVKITNNADHAIKIEGQNMRLFYNSENLKFRNVSLNGIISEKAYDYDLMTNREHLDRRTIDQIDFDHDMGFLNYSIVSNDNSDLYSVLESGEKALVQTVCFTKKNNTANSNDIILATEGVSDKYSKAFVQIEATPLINEIMLPVLHLDVEQQKDLADLHK